MSSEATGGNADFTQSGTSSAGASAANGTAGAGAGAGYAPGADLSFTIGSNQIGSGTPGAGSAGSSGSGGDGTGRGGGTASLSLGGDSSGGGSSGASAGLTDGAGTAKTGGDGNAAAQQYYFAGSSQPLGFSLLPSSTGADGLADSPTPGADSTPLTASLTDSTPTSGSSSLDLFSLNSSNEALYGPGPGSLFDGPNAGGSPIDQYAKGGNGGGSTHGGNGGGGNPHGGSSGGGLPSQLTYGGTHKNPLKFVVNYDNSVTSSSDGSKIESAFGTAIQYFIDTFANPITITLNVGWGELNGYALPSTALGESDSYLANVSYSNLYSAMSNEFSSGSADQRTALASLPNNPSGPISGASYYLTTADVKALGFRLVGKTSVDAYVGFGSGVTWNFSSSGGSNAAFSNSSSGYDFVGVAEHEISETMGRIALVTQDLTTGSYDSNNYSNLDLFRYTASGARATSPTAQNPYLSFDGGASKLQYFNADANQGDLGDWATSAPSLNTSTDAYNYAAGPGPLQVTPVDTREMNVLGYTLMKSA